MRFEFSAGGVVLKKTDGKVEILVCQHSQHHGWVFPKGLIDPSTSSGRAETKEEAALREVKEETGINGKIIKSLSPIEYWYKLNNEKIKKTVYYFLMEYDSGDTKVHDFEMENVEWLPMDKVEERLTYKSDKEVWKEADKLISNY
ncbi:MAG: hypothetical protein A3D74_01920 [Candidatus Levybacteria bacterium RIFCSPHIGHO2_02_FULL_37_13]|nr:MAG: hypothetical protein A3D74_01920 [Candidatus Levybacteria bacterium RIFCSPHIGHO2_02_FULL_37_13]OGH29211.1 MAG: hypothetical protein A3E40_02475 [Candidatus Levybacteria bacterium RIFCSPHIGHO2_12_FULL_37_9]